MFYIDYKGGDFFDKLLGVFETKLLILLEDFDFETLSILTKIVVKLKVDENNKFYQALKKTIVEYLSQEITSMVIQENIVGDIYIEEDFEENSVIGYIEDHLSSFFLIKFSQSDIDEIYSSFDLDDAIQANMNSTYDPDFDGSTSARYSENYANVDLIADLFDRS